MSRHLGNDMVVQVKTYWHGSVMVRLRRGRGAALLMGSL